MILIKEQIDLVKEMMTNSYPLTIAKNAVARQVMLNKTQLAAVDSANELMYYGTLVTVDANGSAKLSIKDLGTESRTFDNTTGPVIGIPNQSYAPYVMFNHTIEATVENGNVYFAGVEIPYTTNP